MTGSEDYVVGGGDLSFTTGDLSGSLTLSQMTAESIQAAKDLLRSSASVRNRFFLSCGPLGAMWPDRGGMF